MWYLSIKKIKKTYTLGNPVVDKKPQPYIEDSDPLIKKDEAYTRIRKHSIRQKGKTLKFVKKT